MTETELRNSVVTIMESWLGATKGDSTHKAIIDTYNTIRPLPRGVRMSYTMDWCAATVSAAFQAAGLVDLIPAECSCGQMMRDAQQRGIWVEDDDYRPKVGDLVLYDWQDSGVGDNKGAPDHVGVVTGIDSTGFQVLEGNMGSPSKVGRRKLAFGGRYIRGFVAPNYGAKANCKTTAPWYAQAMDWAKNAGLMDGTRPEDQITRAEVATVLMRFYKTIKEDK